MKLISYLDPFTATKKALRGWYDREYIIENNPVKIAAITARMERTTGSVGSTPVKGGRPSREDTLVNGITARDQLLTEYKETEQTHKAIEDAFNRLPQDQQHMLWTMYVENEEGQGYKSLMQELYLEKSEVFRRVNKALEKLTHALYW